MVLSSKQAELPQNVAQLRRQIDAGCYADKVAAVDNAASPLGTDEEAAGTPPTREQIAADAMAATRAAATVQTRAQRPWGWLLLATAILAFLGLIYRVLEGAS